MIRDKYIDYNGSKLHYAYTGNGGRHLLVFHGFGQDLHVFEALSRSLSTHFTFYIFDLYFHGKSSWDDGERTLKKEEWKEVMKIFLARHQITDFSLAGFSLGGKFALATLQSFPEQTKEIFLIAPDGIKTSFWYNLATYPVLLRKFFKSMILHPERFLTLANFFNKVGLVDKGLIRFAEFQMNSEEKRRRVYYSWVVFRHLTFDPDHLAKLINGNKIRLTIIVGTYDKVITAQNMKDFLKKLEKYRFEELESGHSGLIDRSLPFFMEG